MKIFGANWRTTVSGIGAGILAFITLLAALPYELGSIADVFPPAWKAKIALTAAIATLILKFWNALVQKDRAVTGGSVAQTLSGAVADPGTQTLVDLTRETTQASGEKVPPVTP